MKYDWSKTITTGNNSANDIREPEKNNNKDESDKINLAANRIRNMEEQMDSICKQLSVETTKFDAKKFFDVMQGYIQKNDRLLYTHITNYIFLLNDETFGTLQTNMDSVINYMYSQCCEEEHAKVKAKSKEAKDYERTKRTILKMWDHINLAHRQFIMFNYKDGNYAAIVDNKMELAEARVSKEMNVQLISLVAIFTALSFLVFGGVSYLDNIFLGVKDIPILKLIIVGCVWCFCIMNLIFVFMFFVSKLTNLTLHSVDDVNANLVKKYALIWWSNFTIVSIFCISCWLYYINIQGYNTTIEKYVKNNSIIVSIGGLGVIIVIMFIVAKQINKAWKNNE